MFRSSFFAARIGARRYAHDEEASGAECHFGGYAYFFYFGTTGNSGGSTPPEKKFSNSSKKALTQFCVSR
jgi:hypothetical protein